MEELQARHRKEQRDLQSQVTQKKKQATKKTRKSVNDECERLESDLKTRQQAELAALEGGATEDSTDSVPQDELNHLTLQDVKNNNINDNDITNDNPPSTAESNAGPKASNISPNASPTTTTSPAPTTKKPSRQKARLARRAAAQDALVAEAAAEATALPDLREGERARMLAAMAARGRAETEIRADGHCLYSAVADQLGQLGMGLGDGETSAGGESGDDGQKRAEAYRVVRVRAAEYMVRHAEDFEPFLEEPLTEYVRKVRDTGEWGGQLELLALAKSYGVDICVLQDFDRVERIESGQAAERGDGAGKEVWLGYYKHGFGLGEHYNSLRKQKP